MLAAMRRAPSRRRGAAVSLNEAKSKAGVGRPLHRYHAVSLITLDGNIQDPIAWRPSGKRAKVLHRFCRHRYAVLNLDLRFAGAAAETSSHFVQCLGRVSHRPFQLPLAYRLDQGFRNSSANLATFAAALGLVAARARFKIDVGRRLPVALRTTKQGSVSSTAESPTLICQMPASADPRLGPRSCHPWSPSGR
jgi:hypothetical protein